MTTKDQAIAWYSQTLKKTRVTQINMDGEDGWMPLFPRPAPDCRTCEYMWIDVDLEKATSKESCARSGGAVCINGSLHKPAPKVVLWRTES